ncbi:MAG: serine/threonine protein kinase [Myxococcales bacterium]|nr:serine/threonine protein kinase [Myxococcales bacterium]
MNRRGQTHRTIPAHAAQRIDEARLDGYDVITKLARGGTSTVYLAEDRQTGERVAIKTLDPFYVGHSDMVHRLLGEHELAQRVHHPGVLEIRGADQTAQGIPYLIMEYLQGESLTALADRAALPIETVVAIGAQIASALVALHAADVVHCDVKPDNVFVLDAPGEDGEPRIKVIDLGVARSGNDPAQDEGTIVGTPAFMAPEQWRGAPCAKSDVYALGCVLYELISGVPVFAGALPQLMLAHCERMPERLSVRCASLDPEVERVVMRALAKDPAMRPTMADLDDELTRLAPRTQRAHPRGTGSLTYLDATG